MTELRDWRRILPAAICLIFFGTPAACCQTAADEPKLGVRQAGQRVVITVDDQPVATYVYDDKNIFRPYFANLKAPNGAQVSRNHPPVEGEDRTDHADMHPGIWLAFGDLHGEDFWRNKAHVRHLEFVRQPSVNKDTCSFVVRNRYFGAEKPAICQELCRIEFMVRPAGYLLLWDSIFSSNAEFYFGDQEEMGLGTRVATAISVEEGGTMIDSQGRKNGEQIWGNVAEWCDYSGIVQDQRIGMTIMCHPENFRRSWMHARDYGFIAANPFGRQAFGKGDASKVVVRPGESLRLRYGVLMHNSRPPTEPIDAMAAFADYVELAR